MMEPAFQADVTRELIAHNVSTGLHVFNDLPLYGLRRQIVHLHRANVAAALHHAEHGSLTRAASSGMLALPFVLVALSAADEGLVNFDLAAEWPIERFGLSGFAEPMRHEPRGFLRHADITGELSAGNPFLVTGDEPDRDEPLAERQLRVLEDC